MIQIREHDGQGLPLVAEGSDAELIQQVLEGRMALYALLMRRYNARLFRIARGITGNDEDAEEVVQLAFTSAYRGLAGFHGEAVFATWLSRIAVREALRRVQSTRKRRDVRQQSWPLAQQATDRSARAYGPKGLMHGRQLRALLESLVDELPQEQRVVFVMRVVQELSTRETADTLRVTQDAVRVRLHRGRVSLRKALEASLELPPQQLFEFAGMRCDRLVLGVWRRLEVTTYAINPGAPH